MKRIFKKRMVGSILVIIFVDVVIGYFLFANRSFPRLAMWNIIESERQGDFYWKPQGKPDYFYFQLDNDSLSVFRKEIALLVKNKKDDLEKVIEIAEYMKNKAFPKGFYKGRLQWDAPEAILKQLKNGKGGNCFHHSILYSTYLASIGIRSRLWTMEGDDGLGELTHTVTEVYIEELEKWILMDVFWGIYFTKDNYPVSLLELRDELLKKRTKKILIHSFSEYVDESNSIITSYKKFLEKVFLRTGNDFVGKYDAKIRYGVLSRFQRYLDGLPSVWRRGLDYLFGRRDFLIHYVDELNGSLKNKIIISRFFFYFFILSIIAIAIVIIIKICSLISKAK